VASGGPCGGGGTPAVMICNAPPRGGLGRRCFWVGLCWLPGAGRLRLPLAWRQQATTAEQIKMCATKHLPFQPLQTVDVAFDGTVAPGPRAPSPYSRRVVAEPLRIALQR